MYQTTAQILQAADVLEKVAYYFDEEDRKTKEKQAQDLESNYIKPIKDSLGNLKPGVAEKLASVDLDILDLIKGISVSGLEDNSLGGPTEKVASDDSDPLLAFCVSDD